MSLPAGAKTLQERGETAAQKSDSIHSKDAVSVELDADSRLEDGFPCFYMFGNMGEKKFKRIMWVKDKVSLFMIMGVVLDGGGIGWGWYCLVLVLDLIGVHLISSHLISAE